jgi:hypothetical protein
MWRRTSFFTSLHICGMLYIVDVQYYQHGGQKVLKEACILPLLQPLEARHFVFQAPFPLHKLSREDLTTANYVHHQLDALHWNEGHHAVEEFLTYFTFSRAIILCNGHEKMLFLQAMLPLCQILNVNVSFSQLSSFMQCPLRAHRQCAWLRAYQLYRYLSIKL